MAQRRLVYKRSFDYFHPHRLRQYVDTPNTSLDGERNLTPVWRPVWLPLFPAAHQSV